MPANTGDDCDVPSTATAEMSGSASSEHDTTRPEIEGRGEGRCGREGREGESWEKECTSMWGAAAAYTRGRSRCSSKRVVGRSCCLGRRRRPLFDGSAAQILRSKQRGGTRRMRGC